LRIIHVFRNPFDSIATTAIKRHPQKAADVDHLTKRMNNYISLLPTIELIYNTHSVFSLRSEDFLKEPVEHLKRLAVFLDVVPDPVWINQCTSVLFEQPRVTRHSVTWTAPQVNVVEAAIARYPWLQGYRFDQ
jgi:hypothetical protein